MVTAPSQITDVVKETICEKTTVPGLEKQSYLPSCLQQCSEMCGVRCRRKCWEQHQGGPNQQCRRGKLGDQFLFCPSSAIETEDLEPSLGYIVFENTDVPTYGKGAAFARMEKQETELPEASFITQFKQDFTTYAEHIVPSWYLRYFSL